MQLQESTDNLAARALRLNAVRSLYRQLARRAATLAATMRLLPRLNPLYATSPALLRRLLTTTCAELPPAPNVPAPGTASPPPSAISPPSSRFAAPAPATITAARRGDDAAEPPGHRGGAAATSSEHASTTSLATTSRGSAPEARRSGEGRSFVMPPAPEIAATEYRDMAKRMARLSRRLVTRFVETVGLGMTAVLPHHRRSAPLALLARSPLAAPDVISPALLPRMCASHPHPHLTQCCSGTSSIRLRSQEHRTAFAAYVALVLEAERGFEDPAALRLCLLSDHALESPARRSVTAATSTPAAASAPSSAANAPPSAATGTLPGPAASPATASGSTAVLSAASAAGAAGVAAASQAAGLASNDTAVATGRRSSPLALRLRRPPALDVPVASAELEMTPTSGGSSSTATPPVDATNRTASEEAANAGGGDSEESASALIDDDDRRPRSGRQHAASRERGSSSESSLSDIDTPDLLARSTCVPAGPRRAGVTLGRRPMRLQLVTSLALMMGSGLTRRQDALDPVANRTGSEKAAAVSAAAVAQRACNSKSKRCGSAALFEDDPSEPSDFGSGEAGEAEDSLLTAELAALLRMAARGPGSAAAAPVAATTATSAISSAAASRAPRASPPANGAAATITVSTDPHTSRSTSHRHRVTSRARKHPAPPPGWPPARWRSICKAACLVPELATLPASIAANPLLWEMFARGGPWESILRPTELAGGQPTLSPKGQKGGQHRPHDSMLLPGDEWQVVITGIVGHTAGVCW